MKLRIFLLLILVSAIACQKSIAPSLSDRGILPLSSENPYLGTNIFLASQMEQSGFLFKFIQGRGGPRALKLDESSWGHPVLTMYYPEEQEYYVADAGSSEDLREWIIRGPYPLSRLDYRYLRQVYPKIEDEPVFYIFRQKWQFKPADEWASISAQDRARKWIPGELGRTNKVGAGPTQVVPEFTVPPTPRPIIKKVVTKVEASTTATTAPTPISHVPVEIPLNADQQAIAMSKGFAERAPNGDVVHTVKFENETLLPIASWYTGNKSNESKIKEYNKLADPVQLKKGDRILIPSNLITNSKTMSSDFYVE